jgi:hypothetical protein
MHEVDAGGFSDVGELNGLGVEGQGEEGDGGQL